MLPKRPKGCGIGVNIDSPTHIGEHDNLVRPPACKFTYGQSKVVVYVRKRLSWPGRFVPYGSRLAVGHNEPLGIFDKAPVDHFGFAVVIEVPHYTRSFKAGTFP